MARSTALSTVKAASAAFFLSEPRRRVTGSHPTLTMPTPPPADDDSDDEASTRRAASARWKQFGLIDPVRGVGAARRDRPRSVEDAGCVGLRRRARNDRARRRHSPPPRRRAVSSTTRRSSTGSPRARRSRLSPPLSLHDAARVAVGARPRADAAAARGDGDRARRLEVPLDDGAAVHRLAWDCGSARISSRRSSG